VVGGDRAHRTWTLDLVTDGLLLPPGGPVCSDGKRKTRRRASLLTWEPGARSSLSPRNGTSGFLGSRSAPGNGNDPELQTLVCRQLKTFDALKGHV